MVTPSLYEEILRFTKAVFFSKIHSNTFINYTDIAHDVILDAGFDDEWKKLVLKHVFLRVKDLREIDAVKIKSPEEKYPCQGCFNDYPKSRFKLSYKLCNKCYTSQNKYRINENNRRWKLNNPEKLKESSKKTRIKRKEKTKAYNKAYRLKNKEKIRQQSKNYREAHKEKIKLWRQTYYLRNKK